MRLPMIFTVAAAVALASVTAHAEPRRLSDGQMDRVTAGSGLSPMLFPTTGPVVTPFGQSAPDMQALITAQRTAAPAPGPDIRAMRSAADQAAIANILTSINTLPTAPTAAPAINGFIR